METITGVAAGVEFTAIPGPEGGPLLVTWHMMDVPNTHAAFAAALPMTGVPAWRVHLGLPWAGTRTPPVTREEAWRDPVRGYLEPVVRQAVEEFPAALAELRSRLPVGDGPIGVVGGSLGGAVALRVLCAPPVPIASAAVVNAAIRVRSVVSTIAPDFGWDPGSASLAEGLDFVARAGEITARLLVVSGEDDYPMLRADAIALAAAVPGATLVTIPGLAHPLTDPAPVDDILTRFFALRH